MHLLLLHLIQIINICNFVRKLLIVLLFPNWLICYPVSMMLGSSVCMQSLYNGGARKFWVHNTGPLGCLPKILALAQKKDLDLFGCLSSYNTAARLFNEALYHLTQKLRTELKDATLVYVDIYAIKHDLITNATKYGNPSNHFLINYLLLLGSRFDANIRSCLGLETQLLAYEEINFALHSFFPLTCL